MIGEYKIITLCGSTKFKDDFIHVQKELTLQGYIVISVGMFTLDENDKLQLSKTKVKLDDMHKRRIDLADEIYVINKNHYIGETTKSEIDYARKTNKKIHYMEN